MRFMMQYFSILLTISLGVNSIYGGTADKKLVSQLHAWSSDKYQIVDKGITEDSLIYVDQEARWRNIPKFLRKSIYIKTANKDLDRSDHVMLIFGVRDRVSVYVGYDGSKGKKRPSWLEEDNGWKDIGIKIRGSSDLVYKLYLKEFSKKIVALGGNWQGGGEGDMNYVVFIKKTHSGGRDSNLFLTKFEEPEQDQ